jgi:hypothetical protein
MKCVKQIAQGYQRVYMRLTELIMLHSLCTSTPTFTFTLVVSVTLSSLEEGWVQIPAGI